MGRVKLEMDAGLMKATMWSGIALVAAMVVCQGLLMHFIGPPSPHLTAQEITDKFLARKGEIRLGCLVMCIFWSFWATWSMGITMFIRKMERSYPILSYCSIALNGGGYVFFILIPMTWAVICFRVDTLPPAIVQVMNDWVWFDYLFTWPPFAVFMAVIGIAIVKDHNVPTIYPRWVAYLNFWCAVLIFPAGLIAFFHQGLFAYNGIGAFWIPFFIFFSWICVMTVATFQAIGKESRRLTAEAPVSLGSVA